MGPCTALGAASRGAVHEAGHQAGRSKLYIASAIMDAMI